MPIANRARRQFLGALAIGGASCLAATLCGQDKEGVQQPVFRIARADNLVQKPGEHPLDRALRIATEGLAHIRKDVDDYTCTMVKRERINGVLGEYEYMYAKIRNRKMDGDKIVVPLSAYLNFVKPKSIAGREVIYVETKNNGKLIAHEGGPILGKLSAALDPNSKLAMRGNLYPITEIGIENLVVKLIEKGNRDKQLDPAGKETDVQFKEGAKINGRKCLMLTVKHTLQRPQYDFEVAQIFIDDQLNVPVRYIAYGWPQAPGDAQPILEEYTYVDVKLNQGLKDIDFDHTNPAYKFGPIAIGGAKGEAKNGN
jgi:uncharacterized protein DUF1571